MNADLVQVLNYRGRLQLEQVAVDCLSLPDLAALFRELLCGDLLLGPHRRLGVSDRQNQSPLRRNFTESKNVVDASEMYEDGINIDGPPRAILHRVEFGDSVGQKLENPYKLVR